jgi:hypothetical protein
MKQQFTDCRASFKLTVIFRHSVCNIMGSLRRKDPHRPLRPPIGYDLKQNKTKDVHI